MMELDELEAAHDDLLDRWGEWIAELRNRGAGLSDEARVKIADEWRRVCAQGDRLEAIRDRVTLRDLEAQLGE